MGRTVKVRVKAGARKDSVEEQPDGSLRVDVKAAAVEGKANEAVLRLLAAHYGVRRSAVKLKLGATSREKLFEVEE